MIKIKNNEIQTYIKNNKKLKVYSVINIYIKTQKMLTYKDVIRLMISCIITYNSRNNIDRRNVVNINYYKFLKKKQTEFIYMLNYAKYHNLFTPEHINRIVQNIFDADNLIISVKYYMIIRCVDKYKFASDEDREIFENCMVSQFLMKNV